MPDHSATGPPGSAGGALYRAAAAAGQAARRSARRLGARRAADLISPRSPEGACIMDYADARRRMVDGQLRPNKVTDPRLLDAMRDLPRERFLPPPLPRPRLCRRGRAAARRPGPDGADGHCPAAAARCAPRPGDRALVVGAGTGYGAAVLARMGARVTALEDERLAAIARAAPCRPACRRARCGWWRRPAQGFAGGAPYDAILIEGEVPEVPAAALRPAGRRRPAGDGARAAGGATARRCSAGGSAAASP